jgi:hypothetical protein
MTAIKKGDRILVYKSAPRSGWQTWKLNHCHTWWFRWYVTLFPVRYREWKEIYEVSSAHCSTLTVDALKVEA